MPRYARWIVCSVMMMAVGTASASAQEACDRACLRTMLDQYLNAVIKHDPAAAPLVVGFRQTENAINVRPGNGVWKSVTALGAVQRRYLDPVSGQAAYYGTMEESGGTAIVTVRVRVEGRRLTEAEWYLARADDPGLNGPRQPGRPPANLHNPDYLSKNPPPDRVVPVNQRSDRATLVRIVNSYFDAITSHDNSVAMTHPGCGRVENGSPAPAGRFLPPNAPKCSLMVCRSASAWQGCSSSVSALITGMPAVAASSSTTPWLRVRMTIASTYCASVCATSATDSREPRPTS